MRFLRAFIHIFHYGGPMEGCPICGPRGWAALTQEEK